MKELESVDTLTFDIFGTVLDLTAGILPTVKELLTEKGSEKDPLQFWREWRYRQRLDQHQDTILMLGHCGYLEAARRALVFTLENNSVEFTAEEVAEWMKVFERLQPFEDADQGLIRLGKKYRLVALSNGNQGLLDGLVENNINAEFQDSISVENFGRFKPHPSVYRGTAKMLSKEPGQIMMVAAHSFDVLGGRACGYRGAFVNRYSLPYEDTTLRPDLIVKDFTDLCERLGC